MKAEMHESGLYVVQSNYLDGVRKIRFSYPKVVAVTLSPGEVVSVSPKKTDGYNPQDVSRFDGEVEPELLQRVAGFIDRYLKDGAQNSSYNCHTFASWMIDGPETTNPLVRRDDMDLRDERPLRQGEPGFVFFGGRDHSVVGLDSEYTIQVMSGYSNLGILTYRQVEQHYGDLPRRATIFPNRV